MQNILNGSGSQHNYNGHGQNIIYGGDQNITQSFIGVDLDARKILWDAIHHVNASHRAEQQSSRGQCLAGTREEVLRVIKGWRVSNSSAPPICWLSGAAGVGKTSIAMTVARSCEEDGLVASFFFFRSDQNRNPSSLMLTIAYGLAKTNHSLQQTIRDIIVDDWSILGARLEEQFRKLVVQPIARTLQGISESSGQERPDDCFWDSKAPNLVVIDGLDECKDEGIQLRILSTIASAYHELPDFPLRFLICSRSEFWIRDSFSTQPLSGLTKFVELDHAFESAKDIRRYLTHEFQEIRSKSKYEFPDCWPSKRDLDHLVERSDSQFSYASTSVRFVKHAGHPMEQLRIILDNTPVQPPSISPFHELDQLYQVILSIIPDYDKVRPILAAILLLPFEPSPECIELLFEFPAGHVVSTLRAMYSVLDIRGAKDGIDVYHTSFTDFLFDHARSKEFCIEPPSQRHFIAHRWIQMLSRDKIGGYSLDQIYKSETRFLFTEWMDFCVSLPMPTQDLEHVLQNLDISALYFCKQNADSSTRLLARMDCPSWDEIFGKMVSWLESSTLSKNSVLIERFKQPPTCFHLSFDSPDYDIDIIHWAVLSTACCKTDSKMMPAAKKAFLKYAKEESDSPLPVRITGCYCSGTVPTPAHRAYQEASLQTVKELVSTFCSCASAGHPAPGIELCGIFRNILYSSLLQCCPYEPEIFSLCERFLSSAESSFHSEWMTPDELASCQQKLIEWVKACPLDYAREANTLRVQLDSFFIVLGGALLRSHVSDSVYSIILNAGPDHDKLLPVLAGVLVLQSQMKHSPSPELVGRLLGLSSEEVMPRFQAIDSLLDIRGPNDSIGISQAFADYLSDRTRSGNFHIDRDVQHHLLARGWLQAISRIKIGGYSLEQLHTTPSFLTGWIAFCTSLPKPTPGLLNDLWNLDVSALYFYSQVLGWELRCRYLTWHETFREIVMWLETATVDFSLIKRFREQPKNFHLVFLDSCASDVDIIRWAVLSTTSCTFNPDSKMACRAQSAFSEYRPALPLRITGCYCNDNGTEIETSYATDHRRYQDACLQTVKAFVAEFCASAAASGTSSRSATCDSKELHHIFRNMLDSSLLHYCPFETELFSACDRFFSTAKRSSSLITSLKSGSQNRRRMLIDWLQTCPDHYAQEAKNLQVQIRSLFPEETPKDRGGAVHYLEKLLKKLRAAGRKLCKTATG